jgi:hypothetical protein
MKKGQDHTELPVMAVVGHPNKGKSSIVAALTHTDTIAISPLSGTTTQAQMFSFYLAGRPLYQLIDTPGFQRPRQMLAKIQEHASNASERAEAIRAFVREHAESAKKTGRFNDEVELLTPILRGAGIIYVVDGSVPYSPEYEPEMTILQWTGQPRMALINPIGDEQYIDQWQAALGQFFNIVRVFNPLTATLQKQCAILSAFAELYPGWQDTLQKSQQLILEQHRHHKAQAAYAISQFLSDVLKYSQALPLPSPHLKANLQARLQDQYKRALSKYEQKMQSDIAALYAHQHLQTEGEQLRFDYPDLFDQSSWYLFGLSRQKLVALSAAAGAAAGALIDVGVGGASLMTGALLGGIASGAASLYFSADPDRIQIHKVPLGGMQLTVGPVKNLQFAFVLLGRALSYERALANHSHANRSILQLRYEQAEPWLNRIPKTQQLALTRLIQKASTSLSFSEQVKLQQLVLELLNDKLETH